MREREEIVGVPVNGRLVFWKDRPESENGSWMFAASQPAGDPYASLWKIRNGDHLAIQEKDKPGQTLWEGTVFFEPHLQMGYPAKKCQKGIDAPTWMKWFSQGFPATLTPGIDVEKFRTERAFDRILKAARDLPARYRQQLIDALEKKRPVSTRPGEGQVYEGQLEDFFEQGSEAHAWLLFRDEEPAHPEMKDYYRLLGLDEGDYLEIFDEKGAPLWAGAIAYDTASKKIRDIRLKRGDYISTRWLQAGVEPDQWVHFFTSGYRARLTKPGQSRLYPGQENSAHE